MPLFPQEIEQDAGILIADSLLNEGQYEKAITKYQEYIDSQGRLRNRHKKDISYCFENIGLCYYKLDNYDDAIGCFIKALDLHKELGNRESIASMLNNIGLNYKMLGNYDKAIEYYSQALLIDEESGNAEDMAKTINNIGMVYRTWGKYDKAIEYLEKSLLLKKGLNDQAGISNSLNNMGLVYSEWGKYDQAILIFKESFVMGETLKNDSEAAKRLNNLGRVYYYMEQYDTAMLYFEKCLAIYERDNNRNQIALAYNNIGKVYLSKQQYKNADFFLTSALKIFNELGREGEKSTVLANLSNINQALGHSEKALQMLDSSTMIAEKLNLRKQIQHNYLYFSEIYGELKDFEKSLQYYKKYTAEKDSMFSREIHSQLSEFQVKYEKEKDQAQILALEKENLQKTNQRNAYMFIGFGILIIALFSIIYFHQKAGHIRTISEQKIYQLEEEKKLIAAKLLVEGQEVERKRIATELHDGLGVLLSATKMQFSIIRDKSPENRELIDKAGRMLEQASGDVRKISHNMMPGLLTQLGFFEAIEDLFEQIADDHDLNVICNIPENRERLAENKEIMLYRIVQEMVNNTLKHARASNITLQIRVNNGILDLIYSDNGKGFDFREKSEAATLGLQSIQSRVNFLNGKIDFISKPGEGPKYILQIPT